MKPKTRTELRRELGDAVEAALSGYQLLYVDDVNDYRDVTLPLVTYVVRFSPNYAPGPDELVDKDLVNLTGTATQLVPYEVVLRIRVHSDSMIEAEELRDRILITFGYAPELAGVGFKLEGDLEIPNEQFGVYAHEVRYRGYTMLEGVTEEAPLVQQIRMGVDADKDQFMDEKFQITEG